MKVAIYLRVATKEQRENTVTKESLQKLFDDFFNIPVWDIRRRYDNLIRH